MRCKSQSIRPSRLGRRQRYQSPTGRCRLQHPEYKEVGRKHRVACVCGCPGGTCSGGGQQRTDNLDLHLDVGRSLLRSTDKEACATHRENPKADSEELCGSGAGCVWWEQRRDVSLTNRLLHNCHGSGRA